MSTKVTKPEKSWWEKLQIIALWKQSRSPKKQSTKRHLRNGSKFKGLIAEKPHITLFVGRKGSGKTQLLIKLLKDIDAFRGQYEEIIIVSPTFKLQPVWKQLSPEGITVYESFSDAVLETIYKEQQSNVNTLLILDDNGDDLRKVSPSIFNKLISNSRHLNLSIIALLQKITQSPTILRSNTDCFIVFSACSERERLALFAEIGTMSKKEFEIIFNDSTNEQYSCFVSSIQDGKIRFYKNFKHEIKI